MKADYTPRRPPGHVGRKAGAPRPLKASEGGVLRGAKRRAESGGVSRSVLKGAKGAVLKRYPAAPKPAREPERPLPARSLSTTSL